MENSGRISFDGNKLRSLRSELGHRHEILPSLIPQTRDVLFSYDTLFSYVGSSPPVIYSLCPADQSSRVIRRLKIEHQIPAANGSHSAVLRMRMYRLWGAARVLPRPTAAPNWKNWHVISFKCFNVHDDGRRNQKLSSINQEPHAHHSTKGLPYDINIYFICFWIYYIPFQHLWY